MALDTPTWLQNGTYSARLDRIFADSLLTEGVMRPGAGQLLVTQRGAGVDDSVDIAAGYAVISGDDTPDQGNYIVRNTATVNLPAAAAPVANSRIDLVCLRVNDPAAGGPVGDDAQFVYVSGVAAGSPVPPATPTSAIALARVLRTVGDTTVVDANITDARPASLTLLSNTLTTAGDLFSFDGSNAIRVGLGSVGLPLVAGATSVGYAQVGTAGIANNAVTSAKILDGTIVTADLADGAVTTTKMTLPQYVAFTPSVAGFTVGNSVVVARYFQISKHIHWYIKISRGTTSNFTGANTLTFNLPVTAAADVVYGSFKGALVSPAGASTDGLLSGWYNSTTVGNVRPATATGSIIEDSSLQNLQPYWTGNAVLALSGSYEAA
jgi:hypothetical protein